MVVERPMPAPRTRVLLRTSVSGSSLGLPASLDKYLILLGAGEGIRTLDPNLSRVAGFSEGGARGDGAQRCAHQPSCRRATGQKNNPRDRRPRFMGGEAGAGFAVLLRDQYPPHSFEK